MPLVTFVNPDGTRAVVDAQDGRSLMQAAVAGRVRGVVAECGGSLMCATCHVYVDLPFADRFPAVSDAEDAMLDSAASERTPQSRLSCQLVLGPEHDGLVVRLPERQVE